MTARIVGHHRLLREIGRGGMGVVYEAEHVTLGERAAVKVVRPELALRADLATRLLREARAGAKLDSERIARVLDAGVTAEGSAYFVMELLRGEPLSARLSRDGPLPVGDAVSLVIEACEPLAEAHARGLVHRDLKPSNLFIATLRDGRTRLKVLDFGVAKAALGDGSDTLTDAATLVGSPRYMAPEQVRDAHGVDARADVWALGVVLFELLSGRSPVASADEPLALSAVTEPGAVPGPLAELVARCLENDRARRPRDAAALALALAPFAPTEAAALARHVAARARADDTADPIPESRLAPTQRERTPGAVAASRASPPPMKATHRLVTIVVVAAVAIALADDVGRWWSRSPNPTPPASATLEHAAADAPSAPVVVASAVEVPPAPASSSAVPARATVAPKAGPSDAVLKRRRQEEELRARRAR